MHAQLRSQLRERSAQAGEKVAILYGGSMKPDNAVELMAQPDIDGGLIGGAALKAADFLASFSRISGCLSLAQRNFRICNVVKLGMEL